MLNYKYIKTAKEEYITTSLTGKLLLSNPQLNKGTGFTEKERHDFGLRGKLPANIESLEQQVQRAYLQFKSHTTPLSKNIYLNNLHNINQVLFYKLVKNHITEMMPFIYTPIVGTAVQEFSRDFLQPRGLYISYLEREYMAEIIANRSNPEVDVIVVSDGEGVLGIGDQGIGAMDIPIAKLMVYTLMGGINHLRTLPIFLDVGTDNQTLLDDPLYLGWRHKRIRGKEYDDFINRFVNAIKSKLPKVFLHWEDFGRENARNILNQYCNTNCTFNDDIQGTGVVTTAAFLAGVKANGIPLEDQRIIIFGAGSAGMGITEQLCQALINCGLSKEQAKNAFWLIDKPGLLLDSTSNMTAEQKSYARQNNDIADWNVIDKSHINLLDTIKHIKPTVLVGSSAVAGAFTQEIIVEMANHTAKPIILPISNPTERAEATPENLIHWTKGRALIATGSPFDDVMYEGKMIAIAQCNNALAFPGIGLGVIAVQAKHVSNAMLWVASQTLMECAPIFTDPTKALLPSIAEAQIAARKIAIAVAKQARQENLAQISNEKSVEELVDEQLWEPHYVEFRC